MRLGRETGRSAASSRIPVLLRPGGLPGLSPSPVIKEIVWAPPETIVRRAKGSDNWPMTWADDDWR